MPVKRQLTGQEEEWLHRAAFGSPCGVMPFSMVAVLVAAEFGEKNARGTLDVNDAGRDYLNVRNPLVHIEKPPRLRSKAGQFGRLEQICVKSRRGE
jgi:hypothetical protein